MKLALAVAFSFLTLAVNAAPFQAVAVYDAEIRSGALDSDPVLSSINSGSSITVVDCVEFGCLVETRSGRGWIAADALEVDGQPAVNVARKSRLGLVTLVSPSIRAEGDSYMAGAYGVNLFEMIAQISKRDVAKTAVGGSTIDEMQARFADPSSASLLRRLTVIWDGRTNGITSADEYVQAISRSVGMLGHDHFIVIPPVSGELTEEVALLMQERWPNNFLGWSDHIKATNGQPADDMLASPADDKIHLADAPMAAMAEDIVRLIREKGW